MTAVNKLPAGRKTKLKILEIPTDLRYEIVGASKEPLLPFLPWFLKRTHPIGRLKEDAVYRWLRADGTQIILTLKAGFEWDGASIPPFAWKIIGKPWNPKWLRGAAAHDGLYATNGVPKNEADDVFELIMLTEGNEHQRAEIMEKAVSWFGQGPWEELDARDKYNLAFVECRIAQEPSSKDDEKLRRIRW